MNSSLPLRRRLPRTALAVAVLAAAALAGSGRPAGASGHAPFNGLTCGIDLQSSPLLPTSYSGTLRMAPWAVGQESMITYRCQLQTSATYGSGYVASWESTMGPSRTFPPRSEAITGLGLTASPPYYLCTHVTWTWTAWGGGGDTFTICESVVVTSGSPKTVSKPQTGVSNGTLNAAGGITIEATGLPGEDPVYLLDGVFAPALGLWECSGDNNGGAGPVTVTCTPDPFPNNVATWGCHTMVVTVETAGGQARGTGSCGFEGDAGPAVSAECGGIVPCSDTQLATFEVRTDVVTCVAEGVAGAALPDEQYTVRCTDPVVPRG